MIASFSTVKGKLYSVCALVALAFLLIAAIALWSRTAVDTSIRQSHDINMAARDIAAMRLAASELVLAAMDTIVDRGEGSVHPDRLTIIADSVKTLESGNAALTLVAAATGKQDAVAAFRDGLAKSDKAVRIDLVRLVESRADDAAFGAIDDAIDAAGSQLSDALGQLTDAASGELENRLGAANATSANGLLLQIVLALLSAAIVVPLLIWIAGGVARSLARLMAVMQRLADEDYDVVIPGTNAADEIGGMARTVEHFKARGQQARDLTAQRLRDQTLSERRQTEIDQLIAAFRQNVTTMSDGVEADVSVMKQTAAVLDKASREMTDRSDSASSSSNTASMNVETVAAAAEQLSGSIGEISRQVSLAQTVVGNASERAKATNVEIASLAEGADRIGQVVTLIQAIAEQTNLLALNATIEAARAGEMGKGFAVVAAEVKQLASQTAKATGEIAAQISSIQTATASTVSAIREIAETMVEADSYTSAIAAAVEEQGAATAEISRNAQEAAAGTGQVVGALEAVTGSIRQAVESAGEVSRVSTTLDDRSKRLTETIEVFLKQVASA